MNLLRQFRALLLIPFVLAFLMAQSAIGQTTVTYEKVLELLELEVKEEKIISMLEKSPTQFTLGEDQIEKLKKAGASEKLIAAMQKKGQKVATGSDASEFIVILDCSGSMKDSSGDGSKWQAAQQAAVDIIESIPEGRKLAVVVYGHNREDGCEAVKVLRPLKAIRSSDKSDVGEAIMRLRPVGHTPIALSLQTAMKELEKGGDGLSQVILITDGLETCKGDPAAEAKKLAAMQNGGRVDVIGYSLNEKESKAVSAIAASGKGRYYDAKSIKDLTASVKEVKKTIARARSEETGPKDMESAGRLKPSADAASPAKLPLGKYVTARLGKQKAHYWLVDLEPGDYQFVWEPKRADDQSSNCQGNIEVGTVDDGSFRTEVKSNPLNEIEYRARLICDYKCKESGERVVKVFNDNDIVDYVFAVYKKGKFSVPFLTKCPPIHKLKVGESITTSEIDGNSIYNNSEWYEVKIPAEDCFIDAEFIRSDRQSTNVQGKVQAFTLQGERLNMETLQVNEIGERGHSRMKLILAEELHVLLRVKADSNSGDPKYTVKLKVTTAEADEPK